MPVTVLLHLSEYAATQSSISHYAKRIDNEAQGKKKKRRRKKEKVDIFSVNGHTEYQEKLFM